MPTQTIEVLRIPGTLFPRGPFDENASYKFLNFVESGGNGYVCLQPCTGIPVTNTAYWFKFVFKGDKGDAFTYADLTAEQKAELVRDATAAAQTAASSAQSAADDAAAVLQKFNTIKAAIDAIDPQSTEGSIQTLAAKQGLLEAELDALGPEIYDIDTSVFASKIAQMRINTSTNKVNSNTGYEFYYAPIVEGEKINITASAASAKAINYGFTETLPASGVDVISATSTSSANVNLNLTAPVSGYVVVSHYNNYFTNVRIKTGNGYSLNRLSIDATQGIVESAAESQFVYYVPVTIGQKVHITATNSEAKAFRYGFTESEPSANVSVLSANAITTTNVDIELTSPINGYVVTNHSGLYFIDQQIITYTSKLDRIEVDVAHTKETVEEISYVELKYNTAGGKRIASDGTLADSSNTSYVLLSADISNYIGKTLYLDGVLPATTGSGTTYCWFTFLNSNGAVVLKSAVSGAEFVRNSLYSVVVPEGAAMLYVFGTTTTNPNARIRINDAISTSSGTTSEKTISIEPLMTFDIIRSSNGEFSTNPDIANANSVASVRFIKVNGDFSVKSSTNGTLYILFYDSSFEYLGNIKETLTANTEVSVSLAYTNCAYIKLCMYAGAGKMARITLTGKFDENWDIFNPRPADNGYHRISVLVNVTNPTCCDAESSLVQDSCQLLPDYGMICLPPTYKQEGEATRLIIYCHGAAVNYSDDATRFNTQDLEPEYWLAEGYAVMDIEGNPFDNENEHICIPQAMDCYVAGYKWAIEHYNLKRDGVFLGGRSMGGQNTFNLMRRECPIPVIAACPNSAASDLTFGYSKKVRKEFCALHMGFVVPSGFAWSNDALTSDEIQVLKDNWDKYIKCCPELSACIDLPDKDTLLGNRTGADRIALWSSLHMIAKCPVKLFGCNQDPSCDPAYTTALYYKMLMNSGQMAELRLYDSNKDYSGTDTSAHHYDTQDPALRTSVTTIYGEELTNIPIVYIEMLQFWRRYEQGM